MTAADPPGGDAQKVRDRLGSMWHRDGDLWVTVSVVRGSRRRTWDALWYGRGPLAVEVIR